MGFRQADSEGRGGFARIWAVDNKGNYSTVKLSTSKKRKGEEVFDTDFQDGFVRFIGSAHEKLQGVEVGEKGVSIQITSCEVTTSYNADTKKSYTNYAVFAFEFPEGTPSTSKKSAAKTSKAKASTKAKEEVVDEDDDLPF